MRKADCFKKLDSLLTEEEIQHALSQSRDEFCGEQHFGLGLWIRNNWLYDDSEEAKQVKDLFCPPAEDGIPPITMPDLLSEDILEEYYRHLKRKYKK